VERCRPRQTNHAYRAGGGVAHHQPHAASVHTRGRRHARTAAACAGSPRPPALITASQSRIPALKKVGSSQSSQDDFGLDRSTCVAERRYAGAVGAQAAHQRHLPPWGIGSPCTQCLRSGTAGTESQESARRYRVVAPVEEHIQRGQHSFLRRGGRQAYITCTIEPFLRRFRGGAHHIHHRALWPGDGAVIWHAQERKVLG
jgi:hypothetical protein